jgi:hypothetical protein
LSANLQQLLQQQPLYVITTSEFVDLKREMTRAMEPAEIHSGTSRSNAAPPPQGAPNRVEVPDESKSDSGDERPTLKRRGVMLGASPMRRFVQNGQERAFRSRRRGSRLIYRRRGGCALCGAAEKQVAFAGVAREGGGALEFGAGFVQAAEFGKQVAAHAWQ